MIADHVCEHGKKAGWWSGETGVRVWSGPMSTCKCCGTVFGYIDSGGMSGKYHWGHS